MMELYKGQLNLEMIMEKFPYKEALLFRDVRIERLKAEKEDIERERKAEAAKQESEAVRSRITKK